ncbi:hypothetical protein [Bradyrhizobium barranii]|uniref:Helix-turn-helix protein n=1 Tax=Bradyrhizobium barranii subsp. barranii TaxID=2823807 RepID=A0A939M664_9BRAD|nr:hypothetical protein [Bradyrhizobium barranii]UEM14946.1 hypothetical protein J4G43_012330 [Bradyrhizobium barranii subsp. barranii]
MHILTPAAATLYNGINAALSPDQLDSLSRSVWHLLGQGAIGDDDATFLSQAIEKRRPQRATSFTTGVPIARVARQLSRFVPRPCRKRLTDEERTRRRQRKRMLGGSSAMPDKLRHHYTEGERAVLCIVAGEVKRHGICDLSIDEIGDRAGVGRTTVQNAMHQARLLGHIQIKERPQRGAKHLTNVVRVISTEWLVWIKRGPSAATGCRPAGTLAVGTGSKSSANMSTSKNTDIKIEEDGANQLARVPAGWHVRAMRATRGDAAEHHRQQAVRKRDRNAF